MKKHTGKEKMNIVKVLTVIIAVIALICTLTSMIVNGITAKNMIALVIIAVYLIVAFVGSRIKESEGKDDE